MCTASSGFLRRCRENLLIGPTRAALLVSLADLRSALLEARSNSPILVRVNRLCDALLRWGALPRKGREWYARPVLESLFGLAEALEDDYELDDDGHKILELSLWDVAAELRLAEIDSPRAGFILRRRLRLQRLLEATAKKGVERLLYRWAALLRPRSGIIRQLPGPFHDDISAVIAELMDAGLPRRAKALATKFGLPVDPLMRWTIEHRPESEETTRTLDLTNRIAAPPRPVPYGVLVCGRALNEVLSAPVRSITLAVSGHGLITVNGRSYGLMLRP